MKNGQGRKSQTKNVKRPKRQRKKKKVKKKETCKVNPIEDNDTEVQLISKKHLTG